MQMAANVSSRNKIHSIYALPTHDRLHDPLQLNYPLYPLGERINRIDNYHLLLTDVVISNANHLVGKSDLSSVRVFLGAGFYSVLGEDLPGQMDLPLTPEFSRAEKLLGPGTQDRGHTSKPV